MSLIHLKKSREFYTYLQLRLNSPFVFRFKSTPSIVCMSILLKYDESKWCVCLNNDIAKGFLIFVCLETAAAGDMFCKLFSSHITLLLPSNITTGKG